MASCLLVMNLSPSWFVGRPMRPVGMRPNRLVPVRSSERPKASACGKRPWQLDPIWLLVQLAGSGQGADTRRRETSGTIKSQERREADRPRDVGRGEAAFGKCRLQLFSLMWAIRPWICTSGPQGAIAVPRREPSEQRAWSHAVGTDAEVPKELGKERQQRHSRRTGRPRNFRFCHTSWLRG